HSCCKNIGFSPLNFNSQPRELITFAQIDKEMHLIEDLQWRGMIQDIMPGTKELLEKEMVSGYIGFDPTSDSLHIGSLVPILLLVHLQKAGHKPFALVGGATGMVGDPSGKSEERNLLSEEILQFNQEGVRKQLSKFLDFNSDKPNAAELVNNYDWFKDFSFLHFIRDVGKHITVNYMMAKDSVKKRLEGETGMSFTEFTYQLVQGYDFYWLYQNRNCKLQMGGSDQWGNIVTGTELVRRKAGGEAFAFTCPLITKADGGKFGKTEKGNVWLDPKKTSPYQFYQFWLNASDEDAKKWIKIFTLLSKEEIEALLMQQEAAPNERALQKKLAEELTCFVHSRADYDFAVKASEILFGNATTEILQSLNEEQLLQVMEGVPSIEISRGTLTDGYEIVSFLADTQIFPSKGEARKMWQAGGLSLNKTKISTDKISVALADLLQDKYLLVQKGKKNYYLVKAV
ncbi:MAG TPA: tyrosine--tRNA ligase, partial [Sediminibacterium sp.]|nr:tyrosine--tRNA ligase [Sediminibacterium sp.]